MTYRWPLLFFSDGAYEPGAVRPSTVGAVILDFNAGVFEYCAAYLGQPATERLLQASANPILEIEMIGVLLGLLVWEKLITGNPVIGFNDNDAVKGALISGTTASERAAFILEGVVRIEAETRALLWWERVPSDSNPADAPSRGWVPSPLRQLGAPQRRSIEGVVQRLEASHAAIEQDGLSTEHNVLRTATGTQAAWEIMELPCRNAQ